MTIIDGKECAKKLRAKIKEFVQGIYEENSIRPKLVVIQVGNNEASNRYVRNKEKACEEVGIISETKHFDESTQAWELIAEIEKLNEDDSVNGILVQLPLPKSLSDKTDLILSTISADKDVDGFRDINIGRLAKNDMNYFPACTPAGIMYLLKEYNIDVDGKHCVIIGRSNIVGKPMAMMLLNKNATVTICHSHTYDLKDITTQADILISAVGKPNFVTADMVKDGAVVIDVGINSVDGKLCGDVCKEVERKASYLTPVPGGVGPMTIAMLLKNTVDSFWSKFHKTEDLKFFDSYDKLVNNFSADEVKAVEKKNKEIEDKYNGAEEKETFKKEFGEWVSTLLCYPPDIMYEMIVKFVKEHGGKRND